MHNSEIIFNEQDMSVFIHGQKKEHAFLEDVYTTLARKIIDPTIPADYLYIRYLNKENHKTLNANELTQEKNRRKVLMQGVSEKGRAEDQFFMNAFISGGCFKGGACSLQYFMADKNIFEPGISVKDIFERLEISSIYEKYAQELKQLQELYLELNPYGRLLQIGIPNKILDEVVYLSKPGGAKRSLRNSRKQYSDVSELLEDIKKSPGRFISNYELDAIEYVLVLTKDIALNPHSGIKIIPYEAMPYTNKETEKYLKYRNYLERFNRLMDEIAKEALKS